ncbi:hypothetical protein AtNW77_MTg0322631 (mitochondrion) [Arabidopsis thaliana]
MLIPGWVVPTLASLGFSRYLFLASVVNQLFPFQHTLWRAIILYEMKVGDSFCHSRAKAAVAVQSIISTLLSFSLFEANFSTLLPKQVPLAALPVSSALSPPVPAVHLFVFRLIVIL